MRRALLALTTSTFALAACAAVLDFDAFDTSSARPSSAEAGPDADVAPFAIHVTTDVLRATTGVPAIVHVTIERRVALDTPILFALTGGDTLTLEAASAAPSVDTIDVSIVAGDRHGLQHATLSATTAAYPSFVSAVPLTVDVRGAPGSLDTSFGNGGIVVTNVTGFAADVATVPDAGIIAAFYATVAGTRGLSLAHFQNDGTLDPTFGDGGFANRAGLGAGAAGPGRAYLVVLPDSRIVAAWESVDGLLLSSFRADGTPDPSFPDGVVDVDYVGGLEAVGDGRLLLSGSHQTRRLFADGGLDPSYGDAGFATTGDSPNANTGVTTFLDGSRAVMTPGTASKPAVVTTVIDGDGRVAAPIPVALDKCNPRTRQLRRSDGRWYVLVGCDPQPFPTSFLVARLDADGGLSPAFGPPKGAVQVPGALVLVDGGVIHAASGGNLPASVTEYLDDGGTAWATSLAGKLDSLEVGGVVVDGEHLVVYGDFGTSTVLAIVRFWL